MEQASPQCMDDDSSLYAYQQDEPLPKLVLQFSVVPGATLTWRVEADSVLRVRGARLWLTRISSPYDHWLTPGVEFRLHRGERIWLSTEGDIAARVSLSCALPIRRGWLARWLTRFAWLCVDASTPR